MLKDQLLALALLLPFLSAPALEPPPVKPSEKKPVTAAQTAVATKKPPVKPEEVAVLEPKTVTFGTDVTVGLGPLIQANQLVEIHMLVTDPAGKELINTRKRGLSMTVSPQLNGTGFLDKMLSGMRQGGVRKATLAPAEVNEGRGLPPFVPAGIETHVTVWVVRTVKPSR
ncbi:MAG: hypothetical protein ABL962_01245 [Fimbriimonadaceae bacterium]